MRAVDENRVSLGERFTTPLESPERLWLAWQGTSPQPWQPPLVGQQVVLPALGMFTSLEP